MTMKIVKRLNELGLKNPKDISDQSIKLDQNNFRSEMDLAFVTLSILSAFDNNSISN